MIEGEKGSRGGRRTVILAVGPGLRCEVPCLGSVAAAQTAGHWWPWSGTLWFSSFASDQKKKQASFARSHGLAQFKSY